MERMVEWSFWIIPSNYLKSRTLKTNELINRSITEIRLMVSDFEYDGSIPLEEAQIQLKLDNEMIINFPIYYDCELDVLSKFDTSLEKVVPRPFLSRLTNQNDIIDKIRGQQIVSCFNMDDDFVNEICGLELENGSMIMKGPISPMGTGHASMYMFRNWKSMKKMMLGKFYET